ncbi:MAG TPA: hypothetical protein VGG57_11180 [Stellaceae bacterium]|jgi:hypothetical protein
MDCLSLDIAPAVLDAVVVGRDRRRALPAVEPGQLWLVEICPDRGLSTAERHLLGSANVILYDRSLSAEVAAILPLGAYAEPAPPRQLPDAAVIERCVRFALDGWSVVRLIDASQTRPSREARLRAIAERLHASGAGAQLPVRIFADAGSRAFIEDLARLATLDPDALGARNERLVVVFDAVALTRTPTYPIAANGLAG